MASITIQFRGMCCHVEPSAGLPPGVNRRTLLQDVPDHISYIEFFTNDVDESANPQFTFSQQYTRFNASYKRVQVTDVKLELLNLVPSQFTVDASYEQRIPKLRDVEPRFTAVKAKYVASQIATGDVAAYFDMTSGTLSSGPSDHFRTVFEPAHKWPIRHLGQWAQLDVEVTGVAPVIRVTGLGDGFKRDLIFKEGADTITIGNQTLLDILGTPNVNGHFMHFFELSNPDLPMGTTPLPREGQGLGVGCSDTNWP